MRIGGPADRLVEVTTEADLITAIRDADAANEPVLLLSGGSNVVIGDEGFRGTVIKVATTGIRVDADACSGAMIHVAAGEDWDAVVQRAIAEEWSGLESMSGIPGLAGSTPVQNVGAYGHEVAETIASVRVWDRVDNAVRTIFAADCGFTLPEFAVQGRPGAIRSTGGCFPASARGLVGADRVRRTGPGTRGRTGIAGTDDRGTGGCSRVAPEQGDGARRGGSRHVECRVLLHEPDPRHDGRSTGGCTAVAATRRAGEDERGLVDRARRASRRATRSATRPFPRSTPWP